MLNSELINKFYHAFTLGDSETMTSCYHDEIVFTDPAFGRLEGDKAKAMWHMLLSKEGNSKIVYSAVQANKETGTAQWTAKYEYGPDNRRVTNHVSANFEFKDGKIIKHTDDFSLWTWSKQALGTPGYLLGWSPFMKSKIQKTTNGLLNKYLESN